MRIRYGRGLPPEDGDLPDWTFSDPDGQVFCRLRLPKCTACGRRCDRGELLCDRCAEPESDRHGTRESGK
jgi:hypothetical protein